MAPSTLPTRLAPGSDVTPLAAVTSTGTSSVYELFSNGSALPKSFYWNTVVTGSPVSLTVALEGSEDASTWISFDSSTSVTGEARSVVNIFPRYVRANFSALSGGTSPTLTVNLGVR